MQRIPGFQDLKISLRHLVIASQATAFRMRLILLN